MAIIVQVCLVVSYSDPNACNEVHWVWGTRLLVWYVGPNSRADPGGGGGGGGGGRP